METPIRAHELHFDAVHAYNGFSPKGDITGDPIYCNYGRKEDFDLLEQEARLSVLGKICIIRYGKIYRGNKVENAARAGCLAVIFFSDPSLTAPFGTESAKVYPNSVWMNGKAMQRGNAALVSVRVVFQYINEQKIVNIIFSIFSQGDLLTEGFPSISGGFRYDITSEDVRLPKIPSQPIGYDDARSILE